MTTAPRPLLAACLALAATGACSTPPVSFDGGAPKDLAARDLAARDLAADGPGGCGWERLVESFNLGAGVHAVLFDAPGQRLVALGRWGGWNGDPGPQLGSLSLAGPPNWSLTAAVTPPPAHDGAMVVHDVARRRVLLFGGLVVPTGKAAEMRELWALSLSGVPTWTQVTAAGTAPPARSYAAVAYDEAGQRLLVFGGRDDAGPRADLWSLSLTDPPAWRALSPAGAAPKARWGAAAAWDAKGKRMLIQGGYAAGGPVADVWALDAAPAWSLLPAAGLPALRRDYRPSALYDGARGALLTLGALDMVSRELDLFRLPLSGAGAWSRIDAAERPAASSTDADYPAALDEAGGRLYTYVNRSTAGLPDSIWALPLNHCP